LVVVVVIHGNDSRRRKGMWTNMMMQGVFELSYPMSRSGWRKTAIRLRGRSSSNSRSSGSGRRKNDSHGHTRKRRRRRVELGTKKS
jgi:hypothetical protein